MCDRLAHTFIRTTDHLISQDEVDDSRKTLQSVASWLNLTLRCMVLIVEKKIDMPSRSFRRMLNANSRPSPKRNVRPSEPSLRSSLSTTNERRSSEVFRRMFRMYILPSHELIKLTYVVQILCGSGSR
jgi:hypothetical protein